MEFIYLIISMALPIAGGAFFVRWLLRSDALTGRGEALFFGIGTGLGFVSFSMFILGLAGVPFTLSATGVPILAFVLCFAVLSRISSHPHAALQGKAPRLQGWRLYLTIALASWIALKTGFVFYESLTRPIFSVDSYLNWAISGKFFFYKAGLLLDPSNEHFFGRGYRFFIGHPLHLPLLQTWIALSLGRFHEVYVKAPGAIYFAGVLGVLYYGVKREAGPVYAVITVFFMASVPIFTAHGQDAYADLPLAFFALAGTVALWRFLRDDNLSYLVLSGIFFGTAMFVKNEGLFFSFSGGTALLLYLLLRKKDSDAPLVAPLAAFIIPIILLAGPWILFKTHYGIGFGHSGPDSGFKWLSDPWYAGNAGHGVHWEVIARSLKEIFFSANHNLIFPISIFAAIFAKRAILKTKLKYLYVIIIMVFSMFLFVYLTLEVTAVMQRTGIHRNILTYLPMLYFATALALSSRWPDAGASPPDTSNAASHRRL